MQLITGIQEGQTEVISRDEIPVAPVDGVLLLPGNVDPLDGQFEARIGRRLGGHPSALNAYELIVVDPDPDPDPNPNPDPDPDPGPDPQKPRPLVPTHIIDSVAQLRRLFSGDTSYEPGSVVMVRNGEYNVGEEGLRYTEINNYITVFSESLFGARIFNEGSHDHVVRFERESEGVQFMGFSVSQRSLNRVSQQEGPNFTDLPLSRLIEVRGNNIQIIHCLTHDGKSGLGNTGDYDDNRGEGNEFYGCYVLNNGWKYNGKGDGVQGYFQGDNEEDSPLIIQNCFWFGGYEPQINLQIYGSERARLNNFWTVNNTFVARNTIIGGIADAHGHYTTYNRWIDTYPRMGYWNGKVTGGRFENNFVRSGEITTPAIQVLNQRDFKMISNTFIKTDGQRIAAQIHHEDANYPPAHWEFMNNTWWGCEKWETMIDRREQSGSSFANYAQRTGATADRARVGRPPGQDAWVTPSKYWSGLAHATIVNHEAPGNTIGVLNAQNLAEAFKLGDSFVIRNAFDPYAPPVRRVDEWNGEVIRLELANQKRMPAYQNNAPLDIDEHPGSHVGCFILEKVSDA